MRRRDVLRRTVAGLLLTCVVAAGLVWVVPSRSRASDLGDKTGVMWEMLEWSLTNTSPSQSNRFDVVAKVTFDHQGSSAQHVTEMFYDGGDTWRFRFTGTKTGTWTFTTQADGSNGTTNDPQLDGHTGTVTVNSGSSDAYGFVTRTGNKWARQVGNDGAVEAFVPQFRMTFKENVPFEDYTNSFIDGKIDPRMDNEGFTGPFIFVASKWVDAAMTSASFSDTSNRNPDPQSFEALERLIQRVHAKDGVVHIWCYGDCARDQCPQAAFGDNGARTSGEKRLLRYIGARLGAVPGWVMGYGYDIPEDADTSDLRGWGNYLRDHMGWKHYLGARDQGGNINYDFWPEADFYSRGHWFNGASYSDVAAVMDSNTSKVHSFDERWWKSRMSEEAMRRQLWALAMGGGASAIFGWDGDWEVNLYPHTEWFDTHFTFWEDRFLNGMTRCNSLTDGWGLRSGNTHYVFYKEDTSSIWVDLSGMSGSQTVIAVDAKGTYNEIDKSSYSPGTHTIDLGSTSDWAIAVGDFGGDPSATATPTPEPDATATPTPESTDTPTPTSEPTGNLALNQPVQASSEESSAVAKEYAVDGDTGTRWASQYSDPQWIYVDLGATYDINRVVLNWETAYGKAYQIQVSDDASTWSDIYSTSSGDGGVDDLSVSGSGRYVRMYGTQRGTQWGYSLWELEVYGGSGPTPTPTTEPTATPTPEPDATATPTPESTDTSTPTSEPTATPTPELTDTPTPSGDLVISNLTAASGKAYQVDTNLQNGDTQYIDRSYTWSDVGPYAGEQFIRTANDDKNESGSSFLSFDVNQDVTVYVVYDNRLNLPSWLSDWSDTGDDLVGGGFPSEGCVLAKDFAAGNVTLGGNENGGSMYNVIVEESGGSSSTATPTPEPDATATPTPESTDTPTPTSEPTATPTPTPEPSGNLALNQPVQASSEADAVVAKEYAVDGDTGTRWGSDYSDPQWIYVDLGATYAINRVVLNWETAYGKAYQIQVSDDASTWSDIYSTNNGDGGVDDLSVSGSGRYVRMYGTQRGTQWGYSLWEFEVYGGN